MPLKYFSFFLVLCVFFVGVEFVSAQAIYNRPHSTSEEKPRTQFNYQPKKTTRANRSDMSDWGKRLNPSGVVPSNRFVAYYFDTKNLDLPALREEVDRVSVKSKGPMKTKGISTFDFGAYWAGQFSFSKETERAFYFDKGNSKVRLLINGQPVPIVQNKANYTFKHGRYIIEVEYLSQWHAVDFSMIIGEAQRFSSTADIAIFFNDVSDIRSELHVAAVYGSSSAADKAVVVDLKREKAPVILWLDSAREVHWRVQNALRGRVLGVVLSSRSKLSSVSGLDKKMPVFRLNSSYGLYKFKKSIEGCRCFQSMLVCGEYSDILKSSERLIKQVGKGIDAYDVAQGAALLKPGQNRVDDVRDDIMKVRQQMKQKQLECRAPIGSR